MRRSGTQILFLRGGGLIRGGVRINIPDKLNPSSCYLPLLKPLVSFSHRQQVEADNEKHDREKDAIVTKMNQSIEENKQAIKVERDVHEEDVERLTREKAELR